MSELRVVKGENGKLCVTLESLIEVCRDKASQVNELGVIAIEAQGKEPGFVLEAMADALESLLDPEKRVQTEITAIDGRRLLHPIRV